MVRYITMKRITQILASALFVITVVTVYLAFDFTINSVVARKTSARKRVSHPHADHNHNHEREDLKTTKKRSLDLSISHVAKRSNLTNKRFDDGNEHQQRPPRVRAKNSLQGKPGSFHKGRTGVKVNKPVKAVKTHRKNSTSATVIKTFQRDKRYQ